MLGVRAPELCGKSGPGRFSGCFLVVRARIPAVSVPGSRCRSRIRPRRAGKRLRALRGALRRVRGVRMRVGYRSGRCCLRFGVFWPRSRRLGARTPPTGSGSSPIFHDLLSACCQERLSSCRGRYGLDNGRNAKKVKSFKIFQQNMFRARSARARSAARALLGGFGVFGVVWGVCGALLAFWVFWSSCSGWFLGVFGCVPVPAPVFRAADAASDAFRAAGAVSDVLRAVSDVLQVAAAGRCCACPRASGVPIKMTTAAWPPGVGFHGGWRGA